MKNMFMFVALGFLVSVGHSIEPEGELKSGGSDNKVSQAKVVGHTHPNQSWRTVKPGASVTFSHDYDGQTQIAETESLTLSLSPAYKSGELEVRISTADGLQLLTESPQSFQMTSDVISIPVQVRADNAGSYRLSVSAKVGASGMMSLGRAFSLTINVGETSGDIGVGREKASSIEVIRAENGENVVRTMAEETIY